MMTILNLLLAMLWLFLMFQTGDVFYLFAVVISMGGAFLCWTIER